ncbi:hypothetical protein NPIL_545641 [Nephila pilipes]|uniref:Uncharacterized protein n=1 Tax=Nephila pilipes TaxID=299642 RepID=A0A8X6TZL5_NEPPI|nr:hypothetical protein NPIL_545641 [Nephila pilipes]
MLYRNTQSCSNKSEHAPKCSHKELFKLPNRFKSRGFPCKGTKVLRTNIEKQSQSTMVPALNLMFCAIESVEKEFSKQFPYSLFPPPNYRNIPKSSKRCSSFPRISVVYNTGLLFLKGNKKVGYRYLLLQRTEAAPLELVIKNTSDEAAVMLGKICGTRGKTSNCV